MKFNFCHLLVCTFAVSMTTLTANADCFSSYSSRASVSLDEKIKDANTTTLSTAGGAEVGMGYEGLLIAADAGALAAGATVAAAIPVSTSAYIAGRAYRRDQAKKVFRLLSEAELGNGLMIVEISTALSKQVAKKISTAAVASAISQANHANIFCPDNKTIYSQKDIYSFLASQFQ